MIEISVGLKDYRLQSVIDFLGQGPNFPYVEIYEGLRPAFGAQPIGGVLMTINLANPIGVLSNGLLNLTPTDEAMVQVDGTASWARVYNGLGEIAWDCDVSEESGSGELKVVQLAMYAGGYARIVSGVLG